MKQATCFYPVCVGSIGCTQDRNDPCPKQDKHLFVAGKAGVCAMGGCGEVDFAEIHMVPGLVRKNRKIVDPSPANTRGSILPVQTED